MSFDLWNLLQKNKSLLILQIRISNSDRTRSQKLKNKSKKVITLCILEKVFEGIAGNLFIKKKFEALRNLANAFS